MTEIRLRAGANLEDLAKALVSQVARATTVWNECSGMHPHDVLTAYLNWVDEAAGQLGNHLSQPQVEAAVRTRHFWALRQMDGSEANARAQVGNEIKARVEAFTALRIQSTALIRRWSVGGVFVVLDTNALVQTTHLLDEIPWPGALGINSAVHLVVPMAVVDQLDRLKRAKVPGVRTRARQTLKKVEQLVVDPAARVPLSAANEADVPITVEVMIDPLEHLRLDDPDSEIVDRANYLSELARTPQSVGDVRLATWDGGMRFRALGAGVEMIALPSEYEDRN